MSCELKPGMRVEYRLGATLVFTGYIRSLDQNDRTLMVLLGEPGSFRFPARKVLRRSVTAVFDDAGNRVPFASDE